MRSQRLAPLLGLALCLSVNPADAAPDDLARAFEAPPETAKPMTWWHWMNGNVTRAGITADLEAMARVGLGGAYIFHVGQLPIEGDVPFLSEDWWDLMVFAVREAQRLGLHLGMHNCPGWSSSGGPWVTPEQSMKKVVWSQTPVTGGRRLTLSPAQPQVDARWHYYRDIAVLALPAQADPVPRDRVLDLSPHLDAGGRLVWSAPAGDWIVYRFGYTTTGKTNHPAPVGGQGLECDKLSTAAVEAHYDAYVGKLLKRLGPLAGTTFSMVEIDSYEVGSQNWTGDFRSAFTAHSGYDPVPWLPVLAGRRIGDAEQTQRFRWDLDRTIADLIADRYYGHFGRCVHRTPGLQFVVEPYSGPFDTLTAGGRGDFVMAEFWQAPANSGWGWIPAVVSSAHTYGKAIVAAESFTGKPHLAQWRQDPFALKATGDRAYCAGVNRFVLHTYAHQPWLNVAPGMTMGWWGTHFSRTQTWWDQSRPWFAYLTRCQALLQQGHAVADVLTLEGGADLPGYQSDACSEELFLRDLAVTADGRLTLPSGATYRLLVLPQRRTLRLAVVRKLRDLVGAGATVLGPRPTSSPSLQDAPAGDAEIGEIAAALWGEGDASAGEHAYGRGRVTWGRRPEDVLAALGVTPPVLVPEALRPQIRWIQRRAGEADLFFVSNQSLQTVTAELSFRVDGRLPELWRADTGQRRPAARWWRDQGRTTLPLSLDPAGSIFVVFRRNQPAGADPLRRLTRNGAPLVAAPPAPHIEIERALYGVLDQPAQTVDVTQVLRRELAAGRPVIAGNQLAGDPARDIVKALRVTYRRDGRRLSKTVPENQTLTWYEADPQVRVTPRTARLRDEGPGGPTLEAWRNGDYRARSATGAVRRATVTDLPGPWTVPGPWDLHFPAGWGAPEHVTLNRLRSWTDHPEAGVRYFSGTARYERSFDLPAALRDADLRLTLDLGDVRNLATVELNGHRWEPLWKPPFRLDVTAQLRPTGNRLVIEVTNLWPNRLIGDEQEPADCTWSRPRSYHGTPVGRPLAAVPDWLRDGTPRPASGRYTFTTWNFYTKDSPLLPSGLLGPVRLRPSIVVALH